MTLNPKPPSTPTQTGPGLEGEPTSSAAGQTKRPWTAPRCCRLDLEGTEGKLPSTTENAVRGPS